MAIDMKPETVSLPEAPASFNVKLRSPQGFSCTLTLRGTGGKELLERVETAMVYLINRGYQPDTYTSNPHNGGNNGNGGNSDTKPCPIHHTEMKKREKDGMTFYSHKTDEGWCNGKLKSNGGSHD